MEREEHERLADELAEQADRLEDHGDEVGRQIDQTRSDWRAKQADPGVPGAVEPAGEDRDQDSDDSESDDSADADSGDDDGR